jgi:hypothetical protein
MQFYGYPAISPSKTIRFLGFAHRIKGPRLGPEPFECRESESGESKSSHCFPIIECRQLEL